MEQVLARACLSRGVQKTLSKWDKHWLHECSADAVQKGWGKQQAPMMEETVLQHFDAHVLRALLKNCRTRPAPERGCRWFYVLQEEGIGRRNQNHFVFTLRCHHLSSFALFPLYVWACKAVRYVSGERGVKWEVKHAEIRKKLHLAPASGMFKSVQLSGIRNDDRRARDLVELAYQACVAKHPNDEAYVKYVKEHLLIDLSQCGSRKPWALGSLKSLTTGSDVFIFAQMRTLLPIELFRLMGWRQPCLKNLSGQACRNLIGESMSLPSLALVLLAVVTSLPGFWEQQ
eukprot:6482084-Amphidinium_carterae.1